MIWCPTTTGKNKVISQTSLAIPPPFFHHKVFISPRKCSCFTNGRARRSVEHFSNILRAAEGEMWVLSNDLNFNRLDWYVGNCILDTKADICVLVDQVSKRKQQKMILPWDFFFYIAVQRPRCTFIGTLAINTLSSQCRIAAKDHFATRSSYNLAALMPDVAHSLHEVLDYKGNRSI